MHGRIVQDLGMDIVGGKVAPGERLPAEVLLCETYGVSRPVLREATRVLVAKGLVVSKPRVGSVVRPRADWHMLDPDVLYWTLSSVPEGEFFRSLLTVRRIIEPAAAALAATSGSSEDLARIEAAYTRMEGGRHRARIARARPGVSSRDHGGHAQRHAGVHRQYVVARVVRIHSPDQPSSRYSRALLAAAQGDSHGHSKPRSAGRAAGESGATRKRAG